MANQPLQPQVSAPYTCRTASFVTEGSGAIPADLRLAVRHVLPEEQLENRKQPKRIIKSMLKVFIKYEEFLILAMVSMNYGTLQGSLEVQVILSLRSKLEWE